MLSDKIICTRCGEHYARLVWHSTSYADYVWKCVSFRRNGGYCRNTHIYEDSLYKLFPLTRKALYSRFKKLVMQNGIDMSFHDLRHLNASVMLMLGVLDKYAMERGGWATDNILKSVYQQTFSSERKKIGKIIDGYFTGIIMGTETAETA